MKEWLLRKWGVGEMERQYTENLTKLRDELANYKVATRELKAKLIEAESSTGRAIKVLRAGVGDVEPADEKKRKDYVAAASNFYIDILEPKLMQMIAQVREKQDTIFSEVPAGMVRAEYDWILKGTSNAFKLLMDWGDQMRGEHQANINKESNPE